MPPPRLLSRCALLVVLFPLTTRATDTSATALQVNWKGPVECGPPDGLERNVKRLLGRHADTADVTVAATASQLDSGSYRIELELSGKVTGIRSLESKNCSEAIQASAVVLALAINPNALSVAEPEPPAPPPVKPVEPPPEIQKSVPEVTSQPPTPLRFIAGIQGRMSGGLAPFPRFGLGVEAGVGWSYLTATLGGFFDPAPWQDLSPEGRARFWKSGARADLCARAFEIEKFSGRICGGLTLTHLSSETEDLADAETPAAWLISPAFGGSLLFRLTSTLSLVGSGGFEVPTTRPRFVISDENGDPISVYQVTMGGTVRLGFELDLPLAF